MPSEAEPCCGNGKYRKQCPYPGIHSIVTPRGEMTIHLCRQHFHAAACAGLIKESGLSESEFNRRVALGQQEKSANRRIAMPSEAEIPPPLPSDREIDLINRYRFVSEFTEEYGDRYAVPGSAVLALIRLLAEERRQSAAAMEVMRGVLGKEPCPAGCCRGYVEAGLNNEARCTACSGTGTRDVIDGCGTLVEAVEQVVAQSSAVLEVLKSVKQCACGNAGRLYMDAIAALLQGTVAPTSRDTARAAVEAMRERAAKDCDDEVARLTHDRDVFRSEGDLEAALAMSEYADLLRSRAAAIRALPLEPADVKEPTP